jgi:acyl carrier protein
MTLYLVYEGKTEPGFIDSAEAISLMQIAEIDREIRRFLITNFLSGHAERLRDDGSLLGDVMDSTGVIELVNYLQERFAFTVEDEDVIPDNFDSVNNLVAFVSRKLSYRAASLDPRR